MKFNRLFLLLVALIPATHVRADLTALFTNPPPAAKLKFSRRPSIIFIQCHDLARGDLSCYGQTNYQTPNLDQLAAEGLRFTNYTGGSDSAATTAQLLFGKNSAPANGEINLAQRLQLNGYHTGLIGEWSLGGQPWTQGFDEFAGFLEDSEGRNYYPDSLWRYAPNTIFTNGHLEAFVGKRGIFDARGNTGNTYLPDLFIKAMNNFVHDNQPDPYNRFRPFFLLVNFPAPRTATVGVDDFPVPSDAPFTSEAWPPAAKNRAALITRLDSGIGRLFEQLKNSQLTNDVAVFFTSSAAPEKFTNPKLNFLLPAGDFRAQDKAPLPLIARWVGTIPAGHVSGLKCSALDMAPTALAIAHTKPLASFTGISLLPVLRGEPGTNTPTLPDRLF